VEHPMSEFTKNAELPISNNLLLELFIFFPQLF
jgi:hypothetical protein